MSRSLSVGVTASEGLAMLSPLHVTKAPARGAYRQPCRCPSAGTLLATRAPWTPYGLVGGVASGPNLSNCGVTASDGLVKTIESLVMPHGCGVTCCDCPFGVVFAAAGLLAALPVRWVGVPLFAVRHGNLNGVASNKSPCRTNEILCQN